MYVIMKTVIDYEEEYLMKKIVSILLASAVSISSVLPVFAEDTFSDVNGNYAWAYDYVEDMAAISQFGKYKKGATTIKNAETSINAAFIKVYFKKRTLPFRKNNIREKGLFYDENILSYFNMFVYTKKAPQNCTTY